MYFLFVFLPRKQRPASQNMPAYLTGFQDFSDALAIVALVACVLLRILANP